MKLSHSILVFLFACASIAQSDLVQLDGTISGDETKSLHPIGENGSSHLLVDNSSTVYLRVAVKSQELYVASLCICNELNEVYVLHASAALGSINYKKEGNKWTTNQKFDWQMREETMDEATIAKRQKYLESNGWVANTMGMGTTGETEFIINRKVFGDNIKLAIGLMTAEDPNNIVGIPANGAGDCADHKLVSGDPGKEYDFNPEKWITIN